MADNTRKRRNVLSKREFQIILVCLTCWIASLLSTTTASPSLSIASTNLSKENSQHGTSTNELFHWEDYSVLATMLIISCGIGVFYGYFGEKATSGDDFLLGGSSMGTFPTALSLAASFVTAIELLGNPAEMYMAGAQFWMICVTFVIIVPISSQLYLPVFMRLRLTSCYEYLEIRFCKGVRVYASVLYMLQMILYTSVAVYAPSLALSDVHKIQGSTVDHAVVYLGSKVFDDNQAQAYVVLVTGLNTYLAVTLVYVVCIFYASQGGMKAVIMTDSFQSVVLIGSLAVVLGLGAVKVGGMDLVWDYARRTDRMHFFDMNPDPTVRHSFWTVVGGGTMYWTSMFCANQASIQKYLSVERISQVRVALWVSAVGLTTVYSVNFVTGAILALHYADCDPIQNGEISGSDRLLPLYVVKELGSARGVPGFFVAGIFAASLGTVASALNSLAAIACEDIAGGLLGITLPENKGALIARWVCVGCGVVSFGLVFAVEHLGPVLQLALSFNGMAGGVSLGLFSLGMLFPWANSKGAVSGGIVGLLVVVIAGGGAQLVQLPVHRLPPSTIGCLATNQTLDVSPLEVQDNAVFWLFRISYLWYSAIGCFATLIVGLAVSLATGATDPATVPVDLISPPVLKLINSLPNRFKKRLRVPTRLGSERRRSSSVRPPGFSDDKDTRRRRRLSELAGGVFYSDDSTVTRGHDNPALGLDPEKHPGDNTSDTCLKLEPII